MAERADVPVPARLLSLLAALGLYGIGGSPTPSAIGPVEILTGLLLVAAVPPARMMGLCSLHDNPAWMISGKILLVYGLSLPLAAGIAAGHDVALILRDVIPFLFLLMPLFLLPPAASEKERMMLTAGAAFIGVAFSVRIAWPVVSGQMHLIGVGADPLYLSIAPTVVFAAIALPALAGAALVRRGITLRAILTAGILAGLALFPLAALTMTLQRASLGLAALSLGFLAGLSLWKYPRRMAGPVLLAALMLALLSPAISDVAASLAQKQGAVGLNMRQQEAAAVLDSVGVSPLSVLFGKGWGATLASPAVGGLRVNFTHSLLTALWLKTGLAGLVLGALYVGWLGFYLFRLLWRDPLVALSLGVPLVIDTVLYASYKSLDFGVILLLAGLYTQTIHSPRQLRATPG